MSKLHELKKHLRHGQVYRRADLAPWSSAVDRHLKQLQDEGTLTKLAPGLYACLKDTAFGKAPAEDLPLIAAFLKDDRFLVTSPNAYNALGVGATQLYNETVVYNHKRHGRFQLGGRWFDFQVKPHFPTSLSVEFLLVDLVNNLNRLAEDPTTLLARVREKAVRMNKTRLTRTVRRYGNVRAKKFFAQILADPAVPHAA